MIYCFEDSTHTSSKMSPASTYKVISIIEPNSSELKNKDDGPPSKNAENATSLFLPDWPKLAPFYFTQSNARRFYSSMESLWVGKD